MRIPNVQARVRTLPKPVTNRLPVSRIELELLRVEDIEPSIPKRIEHTQSEIFFKTKMIVSPKLGPT